MTVLKIFYCSFCHKHQDDVEVIIAGPDMINICNECISLCAKIISERKPQNNKSPDADRVKAGSSSDSLE